MKKVLIVGAGNGGTALLKLLDKTAMFQIIAVADIDENAPGIKVAKEKTFQPERTGVLS